MKKLIIFIAMLAFTGASFAADDGDEKSSGEADLVVQQETRSVFKGILYRVWGKLRAYSPKRVKYRNRSAVTAGIRGAETTTSLIKPYWKDDLTEDPAYQAELSAFNKAQQLAESGDLKSAATALNDFIDEHEDSDLRSNAQFALGITYAGLGDRQASVEALNGFVEDNPEHPLISDAKQVITEMR